MLSGQFILAADDSSGLTTTDSIVVGLYLAAMLVMGIRIARRNESTEDFFVGGRTLPSWAVGISMIASLLSTITYLGMPGEMFRTGVGFLTRLIGIPFVLFIVWFVWIPVFMRMNLTSAYEYLERRFNYATRSIAAVFCMLLLLGWISVVVLTASGAMAKIANLQIGWFFSSTPADGSINPDADMHVLILGIGAFSILYTTLGGLRAVVWTDVVQFFVLIGGALFTMGVVAWKTESGIGDWIEFSREYKHEPVNWFSWDVRTRSTVFTISVGMFFWHMCTHGANQVALQRYFAVKDLWAARRTFLVNALSSAGLGFLLAGVGMSLMFFVLGSELPSGDMLQAKTALVPDLDNAPGEELADLKKARTSAQDSLFPLFIRMYLPAGLRGLVIAALFAAAMSTIDSGANSISTIITVDFARRLRSTRLTAAGELKLARIVTASMGLVVVITTISLYHYMKGTNIIDLTQKGFNFLLGPLGALFMLALFWPKATAKSVIPAFIAGEVTGFLTAFSVEVFGEGAEFSKHLVIPAAWVVTILVGVTLSFVLQTNATDEQRQWMWRSVLKRASERNKPAATTDS